jgi:Dual specificity phosphatase, catalytic domain
MSKARLGRGRVGAKLVYGDYLYLGSHWDAARHQLERLGIATVVNVKGGGVPAYLDDEHYCCRPLCDYGTSNLMREGERLVEFIDQAVARGDKVLVHCMSGVNRSVSIVILYLMRSRQMSLRDAIDYMQSNYGKTRPHDLYLEQMVDIERAWLDVDTPSIDADQLKQRFSWQAIMDRYNEEKNDKEEEEEEKKDTEAVNEEGVVTYDPEIDSD